jgi:hypothetical protein
MGTYVQERLHAASIFMFTIASLGAMLIHSRREGAVPDELKDLDEGIRRTWEKFRSDVSPTDFDAFCAEVWQCRNVDALQRYLERMLFEVFTQRPETLRSSEQMRVSDVLACGDMSEVVRRLAEKRVSALAYQGFDDLLSFMTEQLGMPIDKDSADSVAVREGIEVRNIVVHNVCRINRHFLRKTRRSDLVEGERFPLDQTYVIANGASARRLLNTLDATFISHFALKFDDHAPTPALLARDA